MTEEDFDPIADLQYRMEVLDSEHSRTLTCVFCGEAYPAGTEPHSEQILIDHIEICPKHPLMKARKRADDFEKAFIVMENSFKEASKKIADLWDALDQIKTVTEKVQKKYF